MTRRNWLALPILALGLGTACAARTGVVVRVGPPAPRAVGVIGVAPGPRHAWVDGYWAWRGNRYVWIPGRWRKIPRGRSAWVPGYWTPRGGGWVWIEGYWR
jgi:hypothetical protein